MNKANKKVKEIECSFKQFETLIQKIKKDGGNFVTISVLPGKKDEVILQYFFDFMKNFVIVKAKTKDLTISSLYAYFSNSDFIEREINFSFGVKFLGNPNLEKEK